MQDVRTFLPVRIETRGSAPTVQLGTAGSACQAYRVSVSPPSEASANYRPLYKYLDQRFADILVLRFTEIEDILGFALPDLARRQREWWATADEESTRSAQSRSWTEAKRTATPNLAAQTVLFARSFA